MLYQLSYTPYGAMLMISHAAFNTRAQRGPVNRRVTHPRYPPFLSMTFTSFHVYFSKVSGRPSTSDQYISSLARLW